MKSIILSEEALDTISPLETRIVKLMKPNRVYDARKLYSIIKRKKRVAKSSISVLLDRLYKKGLVMRKVKHSRGGIKFIYSLQKSKEEYERKVVDKTVRIFIRKFGNKAIAYFNESLKRSSKK